MNMNKKNKIQIGLIVLLLFFIIGGGVIYKNMKKEPKNIIAGTFLPEGKDAKEMNAEELKKAAEHEIDASNFTLSIYPEAIFETSDDKGKLFIRNEPTNVYPIAVEIVEDKTQEIIYKSGAIQPGYEITEGKLSKKLGKGTYKCTANVSIFDPKTKKYRGQTAAEMTVEVKN